MGFFAMIKRWFDSFFKSQAERDFKVQTLDEPQMAALISKCAAIYQGGPDWLNRDDGIRTINFAKAICSETARLATLAIGITVDGSARAEWLQNQIDALYYQLRHWVEYGCAYGTVFLKPNGSTVDIFTPADVLITDADNQGIRGIIFKDSYSQNGRYYTRLEYHRFSDSVQDGVSVTPYYISNRAYVSDSADQIGKPIELIKTKWADLMADSPPILKANGEPLDGPLYGVLKTPQANNIDIDSPLGLPVYAEAIEELRDLDIAYSRNAGEIFDSQKIILADDRLMLDSGAKINTPKRQANLPHYVKNVFGNGPDDFYQEINPQLNTDTRIAGINALLSQIGYKAGFANGYFVFNETSGIQTATGVEANQQRTIQYIKDVRDKLENALDELIYALSIMADLYDLAPVGEYEVTYDFGDITYNREEDRARWWQYVTAGKVPAWMYFTKFEGMSEEEAKAMVDEATPKEPKLFGEDE